jgi:NAD(P)-dependent dehydrogenase (short-subunit alcohol dehydrogenase family)
LLRSSQASEHRSINILDSINNTLNHMNMTQAESLSGKVVIVTGGLGQIGHLLTCRFLDSGAKVAVFNRSIPAKTELEKRFPVNSESLLFAKVDVTDADQFKEGLEVVEREWETPHVLVNNAGIDSKPSDPPSVNGPFEEYPLDAWRRVIDVNVTGVMLGCQVIGAAMARKARGSIINVGSIYGLTSPVQEIYRFRQERDGIPFFKNAAYSTSKSALLNMTRHLATYWGKAGVRVNVVTFGGIHHPGQDPQFIRNYTEKVPMGRQAKVDECWGPVHFLASDASSYVTGSNVVMDGGWTAW